MIHATTTDAYAVPIADFVKALGLPLPEPDQTLSYRASGQEALQADHYGHPREDRYGNGHITVTVHRSHI